MTPDQSYIEETAEHIDRVGHYLGEFIDELMEASETPDAAVAQNIEAFAEELEKRGLVHDATKLRDPEKDGFMRHGVALKGLEYGSDENKAQLVRLKPILDHHYSKNSHHPEHHKDGLAGMDLPDLIEMFADWQAAGERHATGNITKSIDVNEKRFGMSPEMARVFRNTAKGKRPHRDVEVGGMNLTDLAILFCEWIAGGREPNVGQQLAAVFVSTKAAWGKE